MDVEWVFFDWGGTLADVNKQVEAFARGATEAGTLFDDHPMDGDAVARLIERVQSAEETAGRDPDLREAQLHEVVAGWLEEIGAPHDAARIAEAVDRMGHIWVGALEVFPWSAGTLNELRRRGYRLGLVSNCMVPPKYARMELARHGLAEHLEFTIFSSGVGYRKPSPRIYDAALREAFGEAVPDDLSRVLFVGDAPVMDVLGPASLGMRTALVARAPGAWPEADYARAEPDFRLERNADLLDLLPPRM